MTMQRGRGTPNITATSKKMTVFEEQVARDWRRFKEKYFACAEYPAVRQALKEILVAEEREMADAGTRAAASHRAST